MKRNVLIHIEWRADAAIQILKDAAKPLHAKEIAERIMEVGLWSSDGKTPETTFSARMYSDIKKYENQSTFVKVAPQTFFLWNTQIVAVYDAVPPFFFIIDEVNRDKLRSV